MGFIYKIINRLSNRKGILILTVIFIFVYIAINGRPFGIAELKSRTGGVGILDMERGYIPDKAYGILDSLGAEGRSFYVERILVIDFLFPLTYMLFFSVLLSFLLRRGISLFSPLQKLCLVPMVTGAFDYIENVFILIMLKQYPIRLDVLAEVASLVTVLKWVLFMITILLTIFGTYRAVYNTAVNKRKGTAPMRK